MLSSQYKVPTVCRYRCERILKASSTCTTLLVRASTPPNTLYIMKRSTATSASKSAICSEAQLLQMASLNDPPNLVKFIETFEDELGRHVLITEWCEGGDLDEWIRKTGAEERHTAMNNIFKQLASALTHLHSVGIMHRDLKPTNIFLCMSNGTLHVKIGDFGVSKEADLAETALGTPFYLSPEIVKGQVYSYPSDIWALGCVMYEIATGSPPFQGKSLRELLNSITDVCPVALATESGDLIMDCLKKNPADRPTAPLIEQRLSKKKLLDRDGCVRLLLERFGKETACGIMDCLSQPDPKISAFDQAKHATFPRPEGGKIIQRIMKLRLDLEQHITDFEIENALALMKRDCREEEMERFLGNAKHVILIQSGGYLMLQELCYYESLLNLNIY